MALEFIDLIETNARDDSPRTSSLAISERYPDGLRVVGVLPHGYEVRPKTAYARDRLVAWLQALPYDERPTRLNFAHQSKR